LRDGSLAGKLAVISKEILRELTTKCEIYPERLSSRTAAPSRRCCSVFFWSDRFPLELRHEVIAQSHTHRHDGEREIVARVQRNVVSLLKLIKHEFLRVN